MTLSFLPRFLQRLDALDVEIVQEFPDSCVLSGAAACSARSIT
ncbi:hypothetical protein ACIHAX_16110 [Nocardia sp. NPDC051929]